MVLRKIPRAHFVSRIHLDSLEQSQKFSLWYEVRQRLLPSLEQRIVHNLRHKGLISATACVIKGTVSKASNSDRKICGLRLFQN